MDIVKMVWICEDCGEQFNRKGGKRHRNLTNHYLQRQMTDMDSKLKTVEDEILSKDDIDPQRSNDIGSIWNKDEIRNLRNENKYLRLAIKEEIARQDKFLKWIHVQKQRFSAELS